MKKMLFNNLLIRSFLAIAALGILATNAKAQTAANYGFTAQASSFYSPVNKIQYYEKNAIQQPSYQIVFGHCRIRYFGYKCKSPDRSQLWLYGTGKLFLTNNRNTNPGYIR